MLDGIQGEDLKRRVELRRVSVQTAMEFADAVGAFAAAHRSKELADATLREVLEGVKNIVFGDGGENVFTRYLTERERVKAEAEALSAWRMQIYNPAKENWDAYQHFLNTKGDLDAWHGRVPKDPEALEADAPKLTPIPPDVESAFFDTVHNELEGTGADVCAWAERAHAAYLAADEAKASFLNAAKRLSDAKAMYLQAVKTEAQTIEDAYAESERRREKELQRIAEDERRIAERKKALGIV